MVDLAVHRVSKAPGFAAESGRELDGPAYRVLLDASAETRANLLFRDFADGRLAEKGGGVRACGGDDARALGHAGRCGLRPQRVVRDQRTAGRSPGGAC